MKFDDKGMSQTVQIRSSWEPMCNVRGRHPLVGFRQANDGDNTPAIYLHVQRITVGEP